MIDKLKSYVDLIKRKRSLEAELSQLREQIEPLEKQVVDEMVAQGVPRVSVDGYTVFFKEDIRAKALDGDYTHVADVLRSLGMPEFTTTNHQKLSAYVRELVRQGDPLPESLSGVIEIVREMGLGARASN
jgi:hypothetical protein